MKILNLFLIAHLLNLFPTLKLYSRNNLPLFRELHSQISQPSDIPKTGTPESPQTGAAPRPGDGSKCPDTSVPTIAFTPKEWQTDKESPIFWFYVPYTSEEVYRVSFKIRDDEDNPIFDSTTVQLSETHGFISLHLPDDSQKLEENKNYNWFFRISCDENNSQDRIDIRGSFTRIAATPDLVSLGENSWQAQLDNYMQNQHWYKAFLLLAEFRQTDPNDENLRRAWTQLFSKFSTEQLNEEKWLYIADQEIQYCCFLKQ